MKPCPFCGGRGELSHLEKPALARRVVCTVCTAQASIKFDDSAAIAAWNRRPVEERDEPRQARGG